MEIVRLRGLAESVAEHLLSEQQAAGEQSAMGRPVPSADEIETILRAGFWASLRREEGRSPRISLALLSPQETESPLLFAQRLRLTPESLTRLGPAVERPGIHLGVGFEGGAAFIWGATRTIPPLSLVLEVIEPALLVVKHQRREGFGKFVNVAVLQGEEVKLILGAGGQMVEADRMGGLSARHDGDDAHDVLIQLATSMRAHRRGGTLLVVPHHAVNWRESIAHPVSYAVHPAFTRLARLLVEDRDGERRAGWQDSLRQAIEGIAGLTAVDGAMILTDRFELLAFGAKIIRREGSRAVEELIVTEPVANSRSERIHTLQIGGTRHLSAAQFVHDQHDCQAFVASQDGRFTAFFWSREERVVVANRVEILLL